MPFLLGRCGHTWREVYLCPVVALQSAMRGKDQEDRQQWSIARWLAYQQMCLSPYIKSYQKPSSPVKFYRFPWEQEQEHESSGITKEQENELMNIIRNFKNRNNV